MIVLLSEGVSEVRTHGAETKDWRGSPSKKNPIAWSRCCQQSSTLQEYLLSTQHLYQEQALVKAQ